MLRKRGIPADCRVVVVGSGVHDTVALVHVGQVRVGGLAAESELQYSHPRQREPFAQSFDIGSNHAEVLCDDGEISEIVP